MGSLPRIQPALVQYLTTGGKGTVLALAKAVFAHPATIRFHLGNLRKENKVEVCAWERDSRYQHIAVWRWVKGPFPVHVPKPAPLPASVRYERCKRDPRYLENKNRKLRNRRMLAKGPKLSLIDLWVKAGK